MSEMISVHRCLESPSYFETKLGGVAIEGRSYRCPVFLQVLTVSGQFSRKSAGFLRLPFTLQLPLLLVIKLDRDFITLFRHQLPDWLIVCRSWQPAKLLPISLGVLTGIGRFSIGVVCYPVVLVPNNSSSKSLMPFWIKS